MPEVMFAGPDGRLEGRYHHSKEPGAPVALVLHPHPLHGGTMNNRVTYTMYQAFQKLGCSVMRFNFRGVGRSQGRYDGGIGEIGDAAAALDWMQAVNPNHGGLWIAGYSFGAFIGMHSTVLDGAVVESQAMVAAGALVTPGKIVRRGELWAGNPARKLRDLTEKDYETFKRIAAGYVALAKSYE